MEYHNCYISLGSNLGDSINVINEAFVAIGNRLGIVLNKSHLYKTEPWGFEAENDFVNAVIIVKTNFSPQNVLKYLLEIEKEFGRVRKRSDSYESRILDLDIISYDNQIINQEDIVIPHPKMHLRSFVLVPLRDVDPQWVHPNLGLSLDQLINELEDTSKVVRLN